VVRAEGAVIVSRPDGSDATVLADNPNYFPFDFDWQPDNTLRYSTTGYLPDVFAGSGTVIRDFDPVTGRSSEPRAPLSLTDPIQIGPLRTRIIGEQPGGELVLVSTPYGRNGQKYWLYDRATGTADYFARAGTDSLRASWHPTGAALYYAFDAQTHYVFDVATRTHARLPGGLPLGRWSPAVDRQVYWLASSDSTVRDRLAAGELPLKLETWDAATGARVRYCLPETGFKSYNAPVIWSLDGRYIAFTIGLPVAGDHFPTPGPTAVPYTPEPTATPVPLETRYDFQFPRTIVLDTQTGYATVISTDVSALILWTDDGGAQ
jgi:hypothetical protein